MKRLLAYLFIVLGLGLTFNVNAEAVDKYFCIESYIVPVHSYGGMGNTGSTVSYDYTLWKSDFLKKNTSQSQISAIYKKGCEFKISKNIFPNAYNKLEKEFSWLESEIALSGNEYYEILKNEKIFELKKKKLSWSQKGLKKLSTSVRNKMGYMSKGGMASKKGKK